MFFSHNPRTNRLISLVLLAFGAIGLASSSWLKHLLHLPPGHMSNLIDFLSGLALGLGITFFFAGSSSPEPVSESDQ